MSVATVSLPASTVVRFSGAHSSMGAASLTAADAEAAAGAEDATVEEDSWAQDARRRAADAAAMPTAYYVTAAEIENSLIVGQFEAQQGGEEFGLLFQKGNPLVGCVNKVLTQLKESGELKAIQDEWLAGAAAPYFTEN